MSSGYKPFHEEKGGESKTPKNKKKLDIENQGFKSISFF